MVAVSNPAPAKANGANREAWGKNNACVVCQNVCVSTEEKLAHEALQHHIKKFNIYTFFTKEAAKLSSLDTPSALLKRCTLAHEKAVGLECINELQFPWAATGWWACSICYESGCNYEQADHHLRSITHLSTYIEEFHPEKASTIHDKHDKYKLYEQLMSLRNEVFEEQDKKLLPPEILRMELTKEEALVKLVVSEPLSQNVVYKIPASDGVVLKRTLVQCKTCHEVIPCFKKSQSKSWAVHENSPQHRHCLAITHILSQFESDEVMDCEMTADDGPYQWKRTKNGDHFGPVCGIKNLVSAGRDNYCHLCYCGVESIEEHFSSEKHILKFLSSKMCIDVFNIAQKSGNVRRTAMAEMLAKMPLDNDSSILLRTAGIPTIVQDLSTIEEFSAADYPPALLPLGQDHNCLSCDDCMMLVKVPKSVKDGGVAAWDEHVASSAHYEFMTRRASYKHEPEFYIPVMSSLKPAPTEIHGQWKNIPLEGSAGTLRIQTQCDIGLEYIVEDEDADEVVCTLCARTYPRDAKDTIANHIRSYMHLNQYLHVNNHHLVAIVLMQKTEKGVQDLLMEWLQRQYKLSHEICYDPQYMHHNVLVNNWSQIKVYSPTRALALQAMGSVPARSVYIPYFEPEARPIWSTLLYDVIDKVADDGEDKVPMDLRQALLLSSCRILHIGDIVPPAKSARILLSCQTCRVVFSTSTATVVKDVFEGHLLSAEHDRRIVEFGTCNIDMYGVAESSSTYTVKPFIQPDPSKKVTWQWNDVTKLHEFVLSVVGLEDLIERRRCNPDDTHVEDFFCRLCAVVVSRRAAALTSHVRSAAHVMCYMHKYHPMTIFEIEGLKSDDGGKVMRRVVAQLLKDVKPKAEYCIPVYDPVGELERKGVLAQQRAQQVERDRQLNEAREKAKADRIKREEERKAIREKEMAVEARRKEERERREIEARQRNNILQLEMARLQQLAVETMKKQEIARQLEELKRERENEAERQEDERRRAKERVNHRSILGQEKDKMKRLQELTKSVHDRQKAMMLTKEKIELEKKLDKLKESNLKNLPRSAPVVDPQLVIPAGQMPAYMDYGQSFSNPSMFSGPSPSMLETLQRVGPMPTFSSFVPQIEGVPVYPTGDDDMQMGSRSPSPKAESSKMTRAEKRRRKKAAALVGKTLPPSPRSRSPVRSRQSKVQPAVVEKQIIRASMKGRQIDPYVADKAIITTRSQLVDFIWRQGAERIPDNELPDLFNKRAPSIEGHIGIDSLYEVVCMDSADMDSFYCSMCGIWTVPSEMFNHLSGSQHKLAYLFRNYKMYHESVMREPCESREDVLARYAVEIWKLERPPKVVTNRLRSVLNRTSILRVWPEIASVINDNWKQSNFGQPVPVSVSVPAPVPTEAMVNFSAPPPQMIRKPMQQPPMVQQPPPMLQQQMQQQPPPMMQQQMHQPPPMMQQQPPPVFMPMMPPPQMMFPPPQQYQMAPPPMGMPPPMAPMVPQMNQMPTMAQMNQPPPVAAPVLNASASLAERLKRQKPSSPSDDRDAKKRRRSPSPKKQRSRSRDRPDRSKRSKSRERKRSRSRERVRRSRSREKKPTRRASRSPARKPEAKGKEDKSWMESAASFLEGLGDHSAAAKLRQQENKAATSSSSSSSRRRTRTPSPKRKAPEPARKAPEPDFSERLAQIRSLAKPSKPREKTREEPRQQPECIVLDDDLPSRSRKNDSPPAARDEKAEMRKLLGVLVTLQHEADKTGGLDASDSSLVDRLYREMGLNKNDGVANEKMLHQLCLQLAGEQESQATKKLDLSAFGIAASEVSKAPPPQLQQPPPQLQQQQRQQPSYQQPPMMSQQQLQQQQQQSQYMMQQQNYGMQYPYLQQQQMQPNNPQLDRILSGIGDSISKITRERPPSPVVKPPSFVMTTREKFFKDDGISYVYPEGGIDKESPQKEPQRQKESDHRQDQRYHEERYQDQRYQDTSRHQDTSRSQDTSRHQEKPKAVVVELSPPQQQQQRPIEPAVSMTTPQAIPSKKQLRKQMLLEQAERLRKQAEAEMNDDDGDDDGDDDWDILETEMTQILDKQPTASTTQQRPARPPSANRHDRMGVPSSWAQPVPQQQKKKDDTPSVTSSAGSTPKQQPTPMAAVPIVPGQKMALARTLLPNGKLPPGVVQSVPQHSAVPAQQTTTTTTTGAAAQPSTVPQATMTAWQQMAQQTLQPQTAVNPGTQLPPPIAATAQGYTQPTGYGGYEQQAQAAAYGYSQQQYQQPQQMQQQQYQQPPPQQQQQQQQQYVGPWQAPVAGYIQQMQQQQTQQQPGQQQYYTPQQQQQYYPQNYGNGY